MQDQVNHQKFVAGTLADLVHTLNSKPDDAHQAISNATGITDPAQLEQQRHDLLAQFSDLSSKTNGEDPQPYAQYVSRFDGVGVFQSVLAKLFQDFPDLQGLGHFNPIWLATPIEEMVHFFTGFFSAVHKDVDGQHKPLLQAMIEAWKEVRLSLAPYPGGTPATISFGDNATVALLADWGGDNPAAKAVAAIAQRAKSDITIHLGDIYYGGTKGECETFLRNWPVQGDPNNPGASIPAGSSYALNGNHEMYTGGESYFNVVLPAFKQPQPFFCLQNSNWRIIGLDSAYAAGSLRMKDGPDSKGISRQWNWLVDLLKIKDGRANIILTHHQPVSAHKAEHLAAQVLQQDLQTLFEAGVPQDAIFGWFFGHEHRAAIYDDRQTAFNARLIGSGCIPHLIQKEMVCEPDCTPFVAVNTSGEFGSQTAAASMYAQLTFIGEAVQIHYVNEDNNSWGNERWYVSKGRHGGDPFVANHAEFIQH